MPASETGQAPHGRDRNADRVAGLVRAHIENPVPATNPREAATVALVRDGEHGIETFLLTRTPTMAFAPGQTVFPGGVVDPDDEHRLPAGSRLHQIETAFGREPDRARAIGAAAAREVHEETGVVLDSATLHPWARWITPEWSRRRYDTYFFVAALPPGQDAVNASVDEATIGTWMRPAAALSMLGRGEIDLFTPTARVLRDLTEIREIASVGAAPRSTRATTFSYERIDGQVRVDVNHPAGTEVLMTFDW